jgi:hypothetical protein
MFPRRVDRSALLKAFAGGIVSLVLAGCNAIDGIESPEPRATGSDGGTSVCGVAPPCPDVASMVTCVGAGASTSCPSPGACDPSSNLDLPCVGSAACGVGSCCLALPSTGLVQGDCFSSLEVTPSDAPASNCAPEGCAAGELQLCVSDAQCGSSGRCVILVIQGGFLVSIGYCAPIVDPTP